MSRNFWIVFKREFTVRVKNKLFLVVTLGTPLLLAAVMVIPALIASSSDSEFYEVAVIDPTGKIYPQLKAVEDESMKFEKAKTPAEELKRGLVDQKGKAALILADDLSRKKFHAVFHSAQAPSLKFERSLNKKLEKILREQRLTEAGLSLETVRATEVEIDLSTRKVTSDGEEETSSAWGFILGYGMGFISFMMVFIYGSLLMKGVMEEKTNRIVEVMVSSVRPFDLMLGKVLGIGSVGLLQFAIWVALLVGLAVAGGLILGVSGAEMAASQADGPTPEQQAMAAKFAAGLGQFKLSLIFYFVFYFLGGYLLYGCLFAAIGASIDQEADAGPLTTIISIPAYLPIMLITAVMNNPDGQLAFWLSIIPFSSPTIMIARMALIDVPWWQTLLSMALLVGGIFGSVWVAARIYRVGLLMYGKKITFGELVRWVRAS